MGLQGLGGGGWGLVAPETPQEGLHRHDPIGSCQQQGQQQAFLRPPQHHRAAVSVHLQRPKYLEPHAGSVVHRQGQEKGPNAPSACIATALPPGHHHPATSAADAASHKDRASALKEREVAVHLDPPAQERLPRPRLHGLLVWSGLTLLAAVAIALAIVIATLALQLGSEPAPPPTPPVHVSPPGGGGGGHPMAE